MLKQILTLIFVACMIVGLVIGAANSRLYSYENFKIAGTSTAGGYFIHVYVDSSETLYSDLFYSTVFNLMDSGYVSVACEIYLPSFSRADSATDSSGNLLFELWTSSVNDQTDYNAAVLLDSQSINTPVAGDKITLYIMPDSLTKYLRKYTWVRTTVTDSVEMDATTDSNSYQVLPYLTGIIKDNIK